MKLRFFTLVIGVIIIAGITVAFLSLREDRIMRGYENNIKAAAESAVDDATEYLTGSVTSDDIINEMTGEYLKGIFVESFAASTGLITDLTYRDRIDRCIKVFAVSDGCGKVMIGSGTGSDWQFYDGIDSVLEMQEILNVYIDSTENNNPAGRPAGLTLIENTGVVTGKAATERSVLVYMREDAAAGINGMYDLVCVSNAQLIEERSLSVNHS